MGGIILHPNPDGRPDMEGVMVRGEVGPDGLLKSGWEYVQDEAYRRYVDRMLAVADKPTMGPQADWFKPPKQFAAERAEWMRQYEADRTPGAADTPVIVEAES